MELFNLALSLFCTLNIGVEIFCAPTADAGEIWKASMTHIALEGGCFVLFSNQFCRRKDYPFPPRDSNGDAALDAITCALSFHHQGLSWLVLITMENVLP